MNEAYYERLFRAAEQNQIRSGEIKGAQDLEKITWPKTPHYGFDHAKQTSQLAVHIGQTLNLSAREIDVLKAAATFHDFGRTKSWQEEEPGHAIESARLAHEYMHKSQSWGDGDFINAVCRVIERHSLKGIPPSEPMLVALWDAECFEAARFAPDTEEGEQICHARFARVITPWAKLQEHQRRWKKYRGWKKP